MKTHTLTLVASFLMAVLGFTSCKDTEEPVRAVGTPPVTPSQEVADFFDAHLSGHTTDFNFNHIDVWETECFLVNSEDELRAIVPEPIGLPEIDFGKYTLIIGQHVFEEPRYSLESQAVETASDVVTLNLVYRILGGAAPCAVAPYYFWGLYDKLPGNTVQVNITTF